MRTIARIINWTVAGLLTIAALGIVALFAAQPVVTGRLLGSLIGQRPGPVEIVPGARQRAIPVASASARTLPPEVEAQVIDWGREQESHAILIFHDGALQLEHYYPGYGPDSLTATQSMHKSVVALLIGIAIAEGHIGSAADPVSTWITEWSGPEDPRAGVTIEQLLRQTSGIEFPAMSFNIRGDWFGLMLGEDILPIVLRQQLAGTPGATFEYSNVGPQILGVVIERATGSRYAEYLSDVLWQKIGVPDAYVLLDSEETRVPRTFCCLDATARSWLALGLLHLQEGRAGNEQVVPVEWIAAIQSPGSGYRNYGYLTWLGNTYEPARAYNSRTATTVAHSEPFAARDMVYFDGFGGQRVYIAKSLGLVIVRTGAQRMDWDDAVLPNMVIRGLQPGNAEKPEDTG